MAENNYDPTGGVPSYRGSSNDFRTARSYNQLVDPSGGFDSEYESMSRPEMQSELDLDTGLGEFMDGFYNGFIGVLEGIANAPAGIAVEDRDWETT